MHPLFLHLLVLLVFFVNQCTSALLPSSTVQNQSALFGLRSDAPWHLLSISSGRAIGPQGDRFFWEPQGACDKPGEDVTVYVVDTGVNQKHPEFEKADIWHLAIEEYMDTRETDSDPESHGTSMASLVVGKTLGLVPHASLVSVKVTDGKPLASPEQRMDALYEAMDLIFEAFQILPPETRFGIIGLSFAIYRRTDISPDPWLEKMARAAELGLIVVNAAGNDRENRCFEDGKSSDPWKKSPLKTHEIVVGASNEFNEVTSFSSRGSCIDFWAPGSQLRSAVNPDDQYPNSYSYDDGTSGAAAFVAGMIAFTKSCLLPPNAKATRDVFVNLFTSNQIRVLEPLASVTQNKSPWLAKLPAPFTTRFMENNRAQVPMKPPTFVQEVFWNTIAVTSSSYDSVANQLRKEWDYDTDLLEAKTDGKGVTVYLLDSGVAFKHRDFAHTSRIEAGQAINIPEVQNGDPTPRRDSSITGRGTRMASLILGEKGGVAPGVNLFPIKICGSNSDCDGMNTFKKDAYMRRMYIGIKSAIDHFKILPAGRKGVISINWPLFYDFTRRWEVLMKEAAAVGLHVVVPAGDDGEDRCFKKEVQPIFGKTRPGKYHEIVVGASTEWNQDASFSSRGECVDIWAPGTHVIATVPGPNIYGSQDGTAQSSAIVTGIVAGILSKLEPMIPANREVVYGELISKDQKLRTRHDLLLGAHPDLAKHAGALAYP